MRVARIDRPVVAADMLPILNVVLLLLAFFLMLVQFVPGPASMRLPHSAAASADRSALPLLRLDDDGHLADDARVVPDAELATWVRQRQVRGVRLQADGSVPAARVLAAIGRLRSAGAERVQLLVAAKP